MNRNYILQYHLVEQGSLPLMLTFDLREEAEPDPNTVTKLAEKYDVIISIKPKPKLSVKSVNIRGYERNAGTPIDSFDLFTIGSISYQQKIIFDVNIT